MTVKLKPGIIALIAILSLLVLGAIGLAIYGHLHYRQGKIISDCRKLNNCNNNEICDDKTGKCIPPGKLGGKCFNVNSSPAGTLGGKCRTNPPICDSYTPSPSSLPDIEPGPYLPNITNQLPSYKCSNNNICVAEPGSLGGECRDTKDVKGEKTYPCNATVGSPTLYCDKDNNTCQANVCEGDLLCDPSSGKCIS